MVVKRFPLLLIGLILLAGCGRSPRQDAAKKETYVEASLPVVVHSNWNEELPGLHGSFATLDKRFDKFEIPDVVRSNHWNATGWRGERLATQLLLWSNNRFDKVSIQFSDLVGEDGNTISSENLNMNFVRYVITDEFADGCSPSERVPGDYASSLSADVLDHVKSISLEAKTTRPVWISINIPGDSQPGVYKSNLKVMSNDKVLQILNIRLEVQPQTLPPATEWTFHLDLWQNPYSVARVEKVETWSQMHWEALRPVMKMLAEGGQKVITTTLIKDPWNGQTEDPYDSMINWTRKKDNSWEYDYATFDNWVQFMMDMGIDRQINCYSMVPWGNKHYFFDEATGEEVMVTVEPGTPEYNDLWRPFLKDFVAHLELKGWKDITCIAMDEIHHDVMQVILDLLEESAPGLGISLADNNQGFRRFPDRITDLCIAQEAELEAHDRQFRKDKSFITTWYVCCAQEFPNVFTFSDPAEATFIPWYTAAAGLDGFLRWAYNNWVADPLVDSRFRSWPAGDTYIVYPDGRSSIRFERLREGIQDVEKMKILKDRLVKLETTETAKVLSELDRIMAELNTIEKPGNLEALIEKGKDWLNVSSFLYPEKDGSI